MQKIYAHPTTPAWLCLLALGLVVLLAACGATTTTTPATTPTTAPTSTPTTAPASTGNSVTISNFAFSPASLMVKVGTQVTWTNKDTVTHTVTANQGAFDSNDLSPGASFSFTFTKAGTYMMATIIVQ
jgi:plastocyanin